MNAKDRDCEAIRLYRELEEWFTDRNFDDLAGLCARLATWHRDAYLRRTDAERLLSVDALRAAAVPWAGDEGSRSREFLWRVATPAQLVELAIEAEESEECASKLRAALGKLGPVKWDRALESDMPPALALGAERRLTR